jgi:Cu2+-exporting ATPase
MSCCATFSPDAILQVQDLSHFVRHPEPGIDHLDLAVDGMTCAACIGTLERGLAAIPELTRARVNFTSRRLAVEWRDQSFDPVRILERVSALGYRAYPIDSSSAETEEKRNAAFILRCLAVAAFASMNIMLLSVSVWSGNVSDIITEQRDFFHWVSALIALPAAAYAGQPFFRSAFRAIASRRVNMDVPITLGVLLALGMSVFETLHHAEHAYFDAAVMLLTFLLAGRYLEQDMRRRTRVVASNLAALKTQTAHKFFGAELREVPVASIDPGDEVLVRAGERIGVDGFVVEGQSDVDQSLVTGETMPVKVEAGAPVYAGTLNSYGVLRIRVKAAETGTLLDDVARLLDTAVQSRSLYVRLADRAARMYAPVVHTTALLTCLGWLAAGANWHEAIVTAIAVLIITCPCALALAIPAVQVVASGALFRAGVLLNSGDAIERLGSVDRLVFDKTGTLTMPEPEIVNMTDVPADILVLAGRLALTSRHPLAAALVQASGAKEPLEGAQEEAGQGVTATYEEEPVRLGRPSFCGAEKEAAAALQSSSETSVIAFAYGDRRYAFAVQQKLREDAASVVHGLRRQGFAVEILSGDRTAPVQSAARALGVETWNATVTPAGKIARIAEIKRSGSKVLMVGDGINDAPALAAATVSMSPVSAAHLTQTAADAVFLGDRLKPVASALAISHKALGLMQQNLWLAVIYNAIAVPLAIAGYVTPLLAAAAMSGSSILVTANALRARLPAQIGS